MGLGICSPIVQSYVDLYCARRQMRKNRNYHFCLRNLSFVNNTESIPNSPKDPVVYKTAFQLMPPLARAHSMDHAVAGGGVWRLANALGAMQDQKWKSSI